MLPITIGDKPYVSINDHLLLVVADWRGKFSSLSLLFSDLKPVLRDLSFKVVDKQSGYYWVGSHIELYSSKPRGMITGLNFQGTLFKFFNWVIRYNNINVPPTVVLALVHRSLGTQGFEFLPDPLEILERSWAEDKAGWRQREIHEAACVQTFNTVIPTGLVEEQQTQCLNMRGIEVLGAPPPNEVLSPRLLAPYHANLPRIRELLNALEV